MKTKNLIVLIIILIVAAAVAAFYFFPKQSPPSNYAAKTQSENQQKAFSVQDKQITDNTKPFVIKITYPYVSGVDGFNKMMLDAVNKEINDFKANSFANDEAVKKVDPVDYAKYPRTYELDISYTKGEINENIASAILSVYNFEGGAHGASYFVPINYNVKDKKEINLADLFQGQPDYLQKISAFCTADLTKQLTAKLGGLDGTYLEDGAGPNADNFQFFLINKDNIVFYFPQYQVAYGAAGDFEVTMPR